MQRDQLDIQIRNGLILTIYPHSKDALCFEEADAASFGESKWQLQEGKEYEYELKFAEGSDIPYFKDKPGIIIPRRSRKNEGTIKTGLYVGTMSMVVVDVRLNKEFTISFEIQSIKAGYRDDYRQMLNDITEYYTDLVMMQGSPVTQKFEIDNDSSSKTLYQKFAFVKSIVDSVQFEDAMHKIIQNPVRSWTNTTVVRHIENVRRLNRNGLRQIASKPDRILCNKVRNLSSLPRMIDVPYKCDTVNTSENQFVKYVLTQFYSFCTDIASKKNAKEELKNEANVVCNILLRYINTALFKDVDFPQSHNLNSPVLQRKEGYREILQGWLIFDLAAKLNWNGGDNVYDAGKRNVAALYEYWLFFKLLEIISSVFNIPAEEKEKLVSIDKDQINLEIKQGRMRMISGVDTSSNRLLNIRFYYNRTFGHREDIHQSGSWTTPMRPDYTLTMWPGDISEEKAEREENIVHIHFDAKYRVNKITIEDKDSDMSNIDDDDDPLNQALTKEKELEETGEYTIGMYKRADILKMHAYKDAIRRTSGAYILYPGTERSKKEGFHEIIPGLGAFCVSPGNEGDQVAALKKFLIEVKNHMLNRASQREKMAYQSYSIYKDEPSVYVNEEMPEAINENRDFQPDNTYVLIGYCAPYNEEFIEEHKIYNVRTGDNKGAIDLGELMKAKYALLWNETGWQRFEKINIKGFKVYSDKALVNKGYTTSEMHKLMKNNDYTREQAIEAVSLDGYYAVCSFNKKGAEKEFRNKSWLTVGFIQKPHTEKLSKLIEYIDKI